MKDVSSYGWGRGFPELKIYIYFFFVNYSKEEKIMEEKIGT